MSQHSGPFVVTNASTATISGSVSHFAAGCGQQTTCSFTELAPNATAEGGQWQTETSSTDRWTWSITGIGPGGSTSNTKDCAIDSNDTSVTLTFSDTQLVIKPSCSSSCSTSL